LQFRAEHKSPVNATAVATDISDKLWKLGESVKFTSKQEFQMSYLLTFDQGAKRLSESFKTEPEAVIRACGLIAQGGFDNFSVEDAGGGTITTDAQIRARCKQTRMP
jgi:hypothetical protein